MVPLKFVNAPVNSLNTEDFPEPETPLKQIICPGCILKERFFNTSFSPYPKFISINSIASPVFISGNSLVPDISISLSITLLNF